MDLLGARTTYGVEPTGWLRRGADALEGDKVGETWEEVDALVEPGLPYT